MKEEDRDPSRTKEEEQDEEVRGIFQSITLVHAKPTFCPPTIAALCFLASAGQERQREPGHEWGLGGARAAGENRGERAQRSPEEGLCVLNAREDKKQPPGTTLGAHPGSLESFLPPHAGHEGHLRGA